MVLLIRKKHLLAAVTGAALLLGAAAVSPRPPAATVSATASTLRQQKVSDTKKRVELVNSFPHGFLISIHQNSLPGHPSVRGAQSFHNGKGTAETAALSIQQALNSAVNERDKAAKRIDDSIYLMKHADCAAVLVECGFLSNPEETVLLQQPDYQLHIAAAIAAGFCQYCTNEG